VILLLKLSVNRLIALQADYDLLDFGIIDEKGKSYERYIEAGRQGLWKCCYEPFRCSFIEPASFFFNLREGLMPSIRDEVMAKRVAEEIFDAVLIFGILFTFFILII
jgi:hypothetical protein